MSGLLGRVLGLGRDAAPATIGYKEAKKLARDGDVEARRPLAADVGMRPEILYFLAGDPSPIVRREIAANASTPRQADRVLAEDVDDEVRCELAQKIGRLVPRLSDEEKDQLRELTFEILDMLARDQLPQVRRIVADEIKQCENVPRAIVHRLASDVELVVAAPVLEYSPLLSVADLLEIIESEPVQGALGAIARRREVSAPVADAVAATDDGDAIADLIANPGAEIGEQTLDGIIDRAPGMESWHTPLLDRPELSVRAVRRIAKFVALRLLRMIEDRHDLPAETVHEVRKAVAQRIEKAGVDGDLGAAGDADEAFTAGAINDESILAALDRGDRDFAVRALALEAKVPADVVQRVLDSRSAKSVTALAWTAGLSMRTAIQLQLRLAKVAPSAVLNAKDGLDYPLTPDELRLHMELFTNRAGGG